MKTKNISIALLLIAGFISCKKESATEQQPNSTQEKLFGKWKAVSITESNDYDNSISDYYNQRDSCVNDDLYIFEPNGTLKIDNNEIKCSASQNQIYSGNWTYNAYTKVLMYYSSLDSSYTTITITSINDQVMTGTQTIPFFSINYYFAWVFNKQ